MNVFDMFLYGAVFIYSLYVASLWVRTAVRIRPAPHVLRPILLITLALTVETAAFFAISIVLHFFPEDRLLWAPFIRRVALAATFVALVATHKWWIDHHGREHGG